MTMVYVDLSMRFHFTDILGAAGGMQVLLTIVSLRPNGEGPSQLSLT